jgi:hypothetical protein
MSTIEQNITKWKIFDHSICRNLAFIIYIPICAHKTSLTPPLTTKVRVPSQEGERNLDYVT